MSSPLRKSMYGASHLESERKDVVISQLKAEAFELRQNERDYSDLNARLNNLHHRYNLLQDEKTLDAREWNSRHEQNQRTLSILKDEVNALRTELAGVDADVQDVKSDNANINHLVNSRNSDIAKLKADLSDLNADNNELTFQRNDLEKHNAKLTGENKDLEIENSLINDKIAESEVRVDKNERLVKELEADVEKCLKINDELKEQGAGLRAQIRDRSNITKNAEQNVSENRKRIISLESRLNDAKRVNDKLRGDIVASQNEQDKEIAKSAQLTEKIHKLEDNIADKDADIADLARQVEELRKIKQGLIQENDALVGDIKSSNRHLDVVTVQHYELIEEVERVNKEDEEIREILQRQDRIHGTINRCQDKLTVSTKKLNSNLQSPVRTASTRDENY